MDGGEDRRALEDGRREAARHRAVGLVHEHLVERIRLAVVVLRAEVVEVVALQRAKAEDGGLRVVAEEARARGGLEHLQADAAEVGAGDHLLEALAAAVGRLLVHRLVERAARSC